MRLRMILPLCVIATALWGCASSGTKLDPTAISRIQKGVSTRAQVDAMLGAPSNVSIIPDGRRLAMYIYTDTSVDPVALVPYVGFFAGGSHGHKQILQVIYKDDVVQDYEFTNSTERISGGMFNSHMSSTPTTAPTSPGEK